MQPDLIVGRELFQRAFASSDFELMPRNQFVSPNILFILGCIHDKISNILPAEYKFSRDTIVYNNRNEISTDVLKRSILPPINI